MPRVEVVHKHNAAARRMYLRGHNGKIYPYLVVNDSGLGEARREERVLQLLRLLNLFLGKKKVKIIQIYTKILSCSKSVIIICRKPPEDFCTLPCQELCLCPLRCVLWRTTQLHWH
jgi:phosphatidylinositol kinase/protein kinase (PI-3  family)